MSDQSAVKDICADIKRIDIAKYNGKMNGIEGKTPFLIGVAGGTASGKVKNFSNYRGRSTLIMVCLYHVCSLLYARELWKN